MRRLFFILTFSTMLAAAEPERGKLTENVAARNDPTQTYTLYLPTSYDTANAHPLLFVFDPRQRGTQAAEIFKDAAERYGWIVISSNQTRSDEEGPENGIAIRALLPEVNRYASDPRRIYASGFSGTAIIACAVGLNTGALAGVIGTGGRLVEQVPPAKFSFAHYGMAGDLDFNNREMRMIDALLEREGKPHRFQQFSGEHSWFGPELAREAIEWMELVAMKEQRRAKDASLIATLYDRDLTAAKALESSGRRVEALRRYRDIVNTFQGLHAFDEATAGVTRLQADAAVQKELREISKWDDFETHYMADVFSQITNTIVRLRQAEMPPTAAVLTREFRIPELLRHAKREGAEGMAARRLLAVMYGQTANQLRRQLWARKEYRVAASLLGVATEIHPDRWSSWYNLGAAQALSGDRRHAYESLEKAIANGFKDRDDLLADEDFASMRNEPRFQALLAPHSQ